MDGQHEISEGLKPVTFNRTLLIILKLYYLTEFVPETNSLNCAKSLLLQSNVETYVQKKKKLQKRLVIEFYIK